MAYFLWYCVHVFRLAAHVLRTRKRETKRAWGLLSRIEERQQGRFGKATRKKIAVYHGIYTPMICDAFARLHGRLTHTAEKDRLFHYFIASSLYDDFTDEQMFSPESLKAIMLEPQNWKAGSFDERVFLDSHLLLCESVKDREGYTRLLREMTIAQLSSREQEGENELTDERLQEITFRKGGYSVLLCRYYLDTPATAAEDACWYRIGAIIQLTNDLYDIHKDLQQHIKTLPDRMQDAYRFEAFFLHQLQEMKDDIGRLSFPRQRKQEFSLAMAGIYAFGLIALDQLKTLQDRNGHLPELATLPRKTLIIDMEKPGNILKWFRYTYRYARMI
ncbi:hypothetical protein [Compostibacter hankyongensis]|uniref:Uncharacterized protein n=1 Tax=Compostibacter hankyongensis TaxID=1007089 RepID=A0ABP8G5Q2_9BACT